MEKIHITPQPLDISLAQGFEGTDIFGYAAFGERLTLMYERVETPFVATLDGQWGSGKTTFARQWAGLLKKKGFPVIYFDAFKNDFQEDPFLALASEILSTAQGILSAKNKAVRKFRTSAKEVAKKLGGPIGKIAVRTLTLGIMSVDDVNALSEELKELAKTTGDDIGSFVETAIEKKLQDSESSQAVMDSFAHTLSELVQTLGENSISGATQCEHAEKKPLVFIIDELDRCRPNFALSLLERIKHFYSVEGVSFLLVTNLQQIQASIRSEYGQETNASVYLEKFFQHRICLPQALGRSSTVTAAYVSHLFSGLKLDTRKNLESELEDGLQQISVALNLSLRSIQHITANIALTLASSKQSVKVSPYIITLCVMRHVDPQLYARALRGEIDYIEVEQFLKLRTWTKRHDNDYFSQWLRYALEKEEPQDEWSREIALLLRHKYDMRRSDIIPEVASTIEELHFTE